MRIQTYSSVQSVQCTSCALIVTLPISPQYTPPPPQCSGHTPVNLRIWALIYSVHSIIVKYFNIEFPGTVIIFEVSLDFAEWSLLRGVGTLETQEFEPECFTMASYTQHDPNVVRPLGCLTITTRVLAGCRSAWHWCGWGRDSVMMHQMFTIRVVMLLLTTGQRLQIWIIFLSLQGDVNLEDRRIFYRD